MIKSLKDTNIVHVAAGAYHTVLLGSDGRVYTFGDGDNGKLGHGNTETKLVPTMIEKDATGNPLAFIGPPRVFIKGASKDAASAAGGAGSVEASDKPASTEASDKPAGESVTQESAPEKSPVEILVDEFKVTKEEAEAAYKLNDENLDDAREYLKPQAEGEGESGNVFDFD